jgi:hypothetical protein
MVVCSCNVFRSGAVSGRKRGAMLETAQQPPLALHKESILCFIGQRQREVLLHDRSRLAQHGMLAEPAGSP